MLHKTHQLFHATCPKWNHTWLSIILWRQDDLLPPPSRWRCRDDVYFFQHWPGTCPHSQRHHQLVQLPWCCCAWLTLKLSWPEPYRKSMGCCQEEVERHPTQQCRRPEGSYQSNLGFHYTHASPQADRLNATTRFAGEFIPKEAQVSIECIEINILYRSLAFVLKTSFFNRFFFCDVLLFWDVSEETKALNI